MESARWRSREAVFSALRDGAEPLAVPCLSMHRACERNGRPSVAAARAADVASDPAADPLEPRVDLRDEVAAAGVASRRARRLQLRRRLGMPAPRHEQIGECHACLDEVGPAAQQLAVFRRRLVPTFPAGEQRGTIEAQPEIAGVELQRSRPELERLVRSPELFERQRKAVVRGDQSGIARDRLPEGRDRLLRLPQLSMDPAEP